MLQQLDSDIISKENTINEQNNKLAEKETVIQSNKADIECLEKKLKVHEEKVKDNIRVVVYACDASLPILITMVITDWHSPDNE